MIEATTDNNNRTVANVRSYFNKLGGSLGISGMLDFLFDRKCVFKIANTGIDLEELELELIDFGAEELFIDEETKTFIETWHYSKSARSLKQKYVFKLVDQSNQLIGVAIYGQPMSRHHKDVIELRRLCLIDDTPRNTESWFIARTLKWLRANTTYSSVISFADPNHGHSGTIYKASNFQYNGREGNGNPRVVQYGDKQYHMRQFYQKRDGHYTADAERLQAAVAKGDAEILKQERKHKYTYSLKD